MKPKNFPARKLKRQLVSQGKNLNDPSVISLLNEARQIRTKKGRGK